MRLRLVLSAEDKARYGLSTFSIQSLACFFVTISIGFLLKLTTVLWGVAGQCTEADQFWFEPYAQDWPLGGTFFLVLFLLLVWNMSIALNQHFRRKKGYLLTGVNFIAVVGLLLVAGPALESSQIRYDDREQSFGDWLIENPGRFLYWEDECALARPYVGRWEVVERDLPKDGLEFPLLWIEFKPSQEVEASDSRWAKRTSGWWQPPSYARYRLEEYRGVGELYWGRNWSVWTFRVDGDRLTLTTPHTIDWQQPATIVLQRIENDDSFRLYPEVRR